MRVSNESRTPSVITIAGLLLLPLINGDMLSAQGSDAGFQRLPE